MSKPKRKTQHALRQAETADVRLGKELAQFRDNSIVRCISAAGKIADQPPLFALSIGTAALGVATHRPGWVRTGMRMAAAEATAAFAKGIIKHYVNRHRPNVAGGDHRNKGGRVVDETPNNSFPSGHSAGAVAVARALARDHPALSAPAYVAAGFAMLGQVPAAKHFPADVAIGGAIGVCAESLVSRLFDHA